MRILQRYVLLYTSSNRIADKSQYQSAMIVPAPPDVLQNTSKVQAIWPGMQPSSSAAVLQNVLANEGSVLGEWWFIPFYCCMYVSRPSDTIPNAYHLTGLHCDLPITSKVFPASFSVVKLETNSEKVYPGDVILSTFTRNPFTGVWLDTWQIQPGVIGYAAGQTSLSGNLTFDPSLYTNVGPYTQILLAIELQGNASWASGQVLWKDIIIETEDDGNDTDWCTQ